MIKMIDDEREEKVTGYGYVNEDGDEEYVDEIDNAIFQILTEGDGLCVYIYKSDVPKLIKALTLAAKL